MATTAALLYVGYASPARALVPCSTTISSCGCSIDSAAVFETSGALASADLANDCIDINASGAVLVLAGDITGPGGAVTADGIHIMSGATGVFIAGRTTPGFGAHAAVKGFATGIQVDASNAEIDQLDASANTTNGVVFNNVTGGDFDDASADNNAGGAGVLISGGSGNIFADANADMNKSGVLISGSSTNRIADSEGNHCAVYGVWFDQSNDNHIKDSSTDHNTGAGTYIGCFASGGPTGKRCPAGMKTSNFNRSIFSGGNSNGNAGVAIDVGDSFNISDGNGGSSNATFDAIDKNRNCDHNVWMEDGFTTVSQACIH